MGPAVAVDKLPVAAAVPETAVPETAVPEEAAVPCRTVVEVEVAMVVGAAVVLFEEAVGVVLGRGVDAGGSSSSSPSVGAAAAASFSMTTSKQL